MEEEKEEEKRRTSPNQDRVGSQRKENGIPMNFEPPDNYYKLALKKEMQAQGS